MARNAILDIGQIEFKKTSTKLGNKQCYSSIYEIDSYNEMTTCFGHILEVLCAISDYVKLMTGNKVCNSLLNGSPFLEQLPNREVSKLQTEKPAPNTTAE